MRKLPSKEEFDKLYEDMERGTHGPLMPRDIAKIFGDEFWELMLMTALGNVQLRADKVEVTINA